MPLPRPWPLYEERSPPEADEAQPTELRILCASKIASCEAPGRVPLAGNPAQEWRSPAGRGSDSKAPRRTSGLSDGASLLDSPAALGGNSR